MKTYKFRCDLNVNDIFGKLVLWVLLCVVTLGLASPFFYIYLARLVINNTEVYEAQKTQS